MNWTDERVEKLKAAWEQLIEEIKQQHKDGLITRKERDRKIAELKK